MHIIIIIEACARQMAMYLQNREREFREHESPYTILCKIRSEQFSFPPKRFQRDN